MDSTLVYVTISKGYKAGSFGTISASTFQQYLPVKQESVLSYEGGVKKTLAGGRVQMNGAVFYYDYTNKQLRSKVMDMTFGLLDVLQNIPKSSVYGVELEVSAIPIDDLEVNVDATYMEGAVDRFTGINASGVAANFSGTQMPATPKWQLSADAQYHFRTVGNFVPFVGASVTYRSSTVSLVGGTFTPANFSGEVTSPYSVGAYTLVNARAGVNSSDGRWQIMAWAKNLFDEYYWSDSVQTTSDSVARDTGMPRTYGITIGYQFD